MRQNHAGSFGARDRIIKEPAPLIMIIRNRIGPEDDDVIELRFFAR